MVGQCPVPLRRRSDPTWAQSVGAGDNEDGPTNTVAGAHSCRKDLARFENIFQGESQCCLPDVAR